MTQTEQLQQLLDKAAKAAGEWALLKGATKWRVIMPLNKPMYLSVLYTEMSLTEFDQQHTAEYKLSVNDLLFGDNLSFLRALFGDESVNNDENSYVKFQAEGLVILPDNERIPTLYKLVFEDE